MGYLTGSSLKEKSFILAHSSGVLTMVGRDGRRSSHSENTESGTFNSLLCFLHVLLRLANKGLYYEISIVLCSCFVLYSSLNQNPGVVTLNQYVAYFSILVS